MGVPRQVRVFWLVLAGATLMMLTVGAFLFLRELKAIRAQSQRLPVLSQVPEFALLERSGDGVGSIGSAWPGVGCGFYLHALARDRARCCLSICRRFRRR